MLPAMFPAMRATILFSLGRLERRPRRRILGAQSGLGYIIVYARAVRLSRPDVPDRALFIVYTSISYSGDQPVFRPPAGMGTSVATPMSHITSSPAAPPETLMRGVRAGD